MPSPTSTVASVTAATAAATTSAITVIDEIPGNRLKQCNLMFVSATWEFYYFRRKTLHFDY